MRNPVVSDRVRRYLLQKISTGQWPTGKPLPSLRQLAYELHVSHHPIYCIWNEAVDRGLLARNSAGEAFVTDAGPTLAAAMLEEIARQTDFKRVAIIVPPPFHIPLNPNMAPLQARLARAIADAGAAIGYQCKQVEMSYENQIRGAANIVQNFDAAFVIEMPVQLLPALTHLADSGLPTLVWQRQIPGVKVPAVLTDDHEAARQLVRQLVSYGHRNICMFATLHYEAIMNTRTLSRIGWLEAIEESGIIKDCIMPLAFSRDQLTKMLLRKVLDLRPRITALMLSGGPGSYTDLAQIFEDMKLQVPRDLSIASTGSMSYIPLPKSLPPVTSFEVNWRHAGQCVISMLQKMVLGQSDLSNVRLPLQMVTTESIGPVPRES